MDYFSNPRGHILKKTMYDILQERYVNHESIIDRMSAHMVTETDMNDFLKFVVDIYETAYIKAVEDQREQLEKIGLAPRIVARKS